MKTAFSSRTIAFLGNYLPRKCGIATFTSDLLGAVAARHPQSRCFAVPVNDIEGCYQYPDVVRFEIEEQDPGSYRRAADYLNTSDVDVVSLQHEFGIFGGPAGSHLLALLGELKAPVVTTLHTVLRTPNAAQRRVMQKLIAYSSRLVVMTERGQTILREVYQAPPASIDVIPHGIPDVPFFAPDYYKDQFGVGGKTVLLTFGLLSPNKGIEHVLNALPDIVAEFPDVVYIVLGATHPNELRTRGEAYRLGLEAIARKKNLERNVMFHNRFVELRELTEFIGAADLYITPYLEEAQITSGTLAYAFGAGKAVISTPYWHAAELLSQQRGVLVPFADPMAIAREVSGLLRDGTRRNAMSGNAYRLGREMVWSNTAALYMRSFELARRQGAAAPRESVAAEKLAKVAGIVSGHPGLKLDVEGYTDSVGGDAYNQRLSERRGAAVRDYLTQEGMAASAVATNGFGKAGPVASNGAAQGLAAESTGGAGDLRRGDWHGDRHTDRIQLVGGRCDAGAWHSVVGPRSHSFRPPVERLYD
ncbi:MAG: OmpA family protein [Bryobacteraceae bacterium]